jgi:DNA-binding MarR family transcriptional regulator
MFMAAPRAAFDHGTAPMSMVSPKPRFTAKQGQYLAFIHTYVLLHRRAPAEADIERYFRVTPPSVHRMIVELERRGLIQRQPRVARSIALCVDPQEIPPLLPQPIETSATRY